MESNWLKPSEALNRAFFHAQTGGANDKDKEAVIRRLGFRISSIGLLIAEDVISELTDMENICSIPNTAPWLMGLANLRGNLIPVFDLVMFFGLEATENKIKPMLLVLGQGSSAAAVVINELPGHQLLQSDEELTNLPGLPDALSPYITKGYQQDDRLWFTFEHIPFFQSLAPQIPV
jgi:twitching motility protein PilI